MELNINKIGIKEIHFKFSNCWLSKAPSARFVNRYSKWRFGNWKIWNKNQFNTPEAQNELTRITQELNSDDDKIHTLADDLVSNLTTGPRGAHQSKNEEKQSAQPGLLWKHSFFCNQFLSIC